MRKLLLGLAASTALLAAGAANAAVTVAIYHTDANAAAAAGNATIAQAAGMTADATGIAVGPIDFTDAPGNDSNSFTVGDFLNNPAGLNATVAAYTLNNTYFLFTGTLFLNAGDNAFVIPHDDGLQLNIDGIGLVVDQPGPTSPVDTPFNVIAPHAGTFTFQLAYGEVFGGPAVLGFEINDNPVGGGVPEPATWAMMLVGFGGLGAMIRRRRTLATA